MATDTTSSARTDDSADTLHLARWTVTSGSNANSRGAVVIAFEVVRRLGAAQEQRALRAALATSAAAEEGAPA